MDEQNNQFSENQESKEEIKEIKSNDSKPIPIIAIIIGAIAIMVVVIAVVLILLLGGNNNRYDSTSHTHTYGKWETAKASTCTTEGTKERYCNCGEKQTSSIAKVSHTNSEWITDKEATCTENGGKHQICSVCKSTIKTEIITKLGHTDGEWITDKEATCTENGSKHQICSVCESTIKTEIITKLGHTDGEWITDKEATCTEDGSKHQLCSICEENIKTQNINAKGHSFSTWQPTEEATCLSDGLEVRVCNCGKSESRIIYASGHDYITETNSPTSTSKGYISTVCSKCQDCTFSQEWDAITLKVSMLRYANTDKYIIYKIEVDGGFNQCMGVFPPYEINVINTPPDSIIYDVLTVYEIRDASTDDLLYYNVGTYKQYSKEDSYYEIIVYDGNDRYVFTVNYYNQTPVLVSGPTI